MARPKSNTTKKTTGTEKKKKPGRPRKKPINEVEDVMEEPIVQEEETVQEVVENEKGIAAPEETEEAIDEKVPEEICTTGEVEECTDTAEIQTEEDETEAVEAETEPEEGVAVPELKPVDKEIKPFDNTKEKYPQETSKKKPGFIRRKIENLRNRINYYWNGQEMDI